MRDSGNVFSIVPVGGVQSQTRTEDTAQDADALLAEIRNVFRQQNRADDPEADEHRATTEDAQAPDSLVAEPEILTEADSDKLVEAADPIPDAVEPEPENVSAVPDIPQPDSVQSDTPAAQAPDMLRLSLLLYRREQGTAIGHFQTILQGLCALEYGIERAICHMSSMEMQIDGVTMTIDMERAATPCPGDRTLVRPDWPGAGLRKPALSHIVAHHDSVVQLAIAGHAPESLRDDILRVVLMLVSPRAVLLDMADASFVLSPEELIALSGDVSVLLPGAPVSLPPRRYLRAASGDDMSEQPAIFVRSARRSPERRDTAIMPALPPELAALVDQRQAGNKALPTKADEILRMALRHLPDGPLPTDNTYDGGRRTRFRIAAIAATLTMALFVLAPSEGSTANRGDHASHDGMATVIAPALPSYAPDF